MAPLPLNVSTGRSLLSIKRPTYAIYGVSWDKGPSPILTRTDASVGLVANVGLDMQVVINDFDHAEIYRDITEVTDSYGNVFVRIPKFYIRKTDGVGYKTWQISRGMFAGAYLPWCFWNFNTSAELPYVDIGKYYPSLSVDTTKIESKSGTYALIKKTIGQYRGYAQANGAGYQLWDIHVMDMLQTLFIVEFATLNCQSIMAGASSLRYNTGDTARVAENGVNRIIVLNAVAGYFAVGQSISVSTSGSGNQIFYGRTITSIDVYDGTRKAISFDGAAVNIAIGNIVYNTAWKSGFSSGIAAKSGGIVSLSSGLYPMTYRGIEDYYADRSILMDGINAMGYQSWVCKNAALYASDIFVYPYEQLGYVDAITNGGFVVSRGWDANYPFAEIPSVAAGGSDSTYYCDYYGGDAAGPYAAVWSTGGDVRAGIFAMVLYIPSNFNGTPYTTRMVRKVV